MTKVEQFVVAVCKQRFDVPKPYTVKATGEQKVTRIVTGFELGSLLSNHFAMKDKDTRVTFLKSMVSRGMIKSAWAGTPAYADNRHVVNGGDSKEFAALITKYGKA